MLDERGILVVLEDHLFESSRLNSPMFLDQYLWKFRENMFNNVYSVVVLLVLFYDASGGLLEAL